MKRSDLIRTIQMKYPRMDINEATSILDCLFDEITENLVKGQRVEIRRFGSFAPRKFATRMGYNPKTAQVISVASKRGMHFKMGTDLAKRLNNAE